MNYVLMSNKYQDSYFSADDDKEAELYVEREYTTEDGKNESLSSRTCMRMAGTHNRRIRM